MTEHSVSTPAVAISTPAGALSTPAGAPTRLLDDPTLSGSLRSDLALAQASAPVTYDVQAGLTRFEQSLATPASGSALGAAAGLRLLGWLLGASVLIGGGIEAARVIDQPPSARPHVAVAAIVDIEPEDAPVAGMASSVTREPVAEVEAPPAPVDSGEAAALDEPQSPRPAALRPERDAAKPLGPMPEPVPIDPATEEIWQLNVARKALEHDPAKTLALVEALEQQFPDGVMIEERRGYAILALVALGRTAEAEQRADSYLERWPNGTMSRRVRRALGR